MEFLERQEAARRSAEERGWPGIAVLGRGGGTFDRHGALFYLSGHYQAYVHLPANPPLWSGRSHALLMLPVERDPILLCSAPEIDPGLPLDDVRVAGDFAADASALLNELGGGGFAGLDVVPASIGAILPLEKFAPADDMLEALRRTKSQAERRVLEYACKTGTAAVEAMIDAARPGTTEGETVAAGLSIAISAGAWPYLVALAAGDRVTSYTGRPLLGYRPERRFESGELVRLDFVVVYEGYYCDFGRSWVVGGETQNEPGSQLVEIVRSALSAACGAARPGATAADVVAAGVGALPAGFSTVYPGHWGHGLGVTWEGPWLLPDNNEVLNEGYVLAVETCVQGPSGLVAGGEDDVVVGRAGSDVLTTARWSP